MFRYLGIAGALLSSAHGYRAYGHRMPRTLLFASHRGGESKPQVFVRNVAHTDAQSLRTAMEETFGHVTEVWLPTSSDGTRMTYGAVTFRDSASMTTADGQKRTDM